MDKFKGTKVRAVAVEPTACPTLTKGKIGPLAKMYTVGHDFVPAGIHAGGLRYHGGQSSVFEAAVIFARTEGIVPASHAIRAAIDEALLCKEFLTWPLMTTTLAENLVTWIIRKRKLQEV